MDLWDQNWFYLAVAAGVAEAIGWLHLLASIGV